MSRKRLKILQIISGREVNGALVYCRLLSNMLAQRGHEVTILHRPGSWMQQQSYADGVRLESSTLGRIPPAELRRRANWVRQQRFDLVHTHMTRAHTFGVLLKMLTGIPVIATAHSRHFEVHWRFNDFIIANSQSTEKFHRRINWIPQRKITTVYACTDLSRFQDLTPRDNRIIRRQLRVSEDTFLLGLVGEVLPRKGHWFLFQALPEIMRAVPNLQLVLLGRFHRREAYVRQLRRWLVDNQLFRRTHWLGRRPNVHQFMHAFDLTVVPSIEEPLGLVAIESLAAGTPVVASDTGGLSEIVRHGYNGILVPPRDPDALAEAIVALAGDEEARRALGQQGREDVMQTFAPELLVDQVEACYFAELERRQAA